MQTKRSGVGISRASPKSEEFSLCKRSEAEFAFLVPRRRARSFRYAFFAKKGDGMIKDSVSNYYTGMIF